MFLSALQPFQIAIVIAVVVLQYAFALFCLLKLAYLDLDKKHYILWNVFILIVFFIGGTVFLVYYYRHPELRLKPEDTVVPSDTEKENSVETDEARKPEDTPEEKEEAEEPEEPDTE